MAKEATLQVRMDAELKESAEKLYRDMGTSFAEAVRVFARQSVLQNGMPFIISAGKKGHAYGKLSRYASPDKVNEEKSAFEKAAIEKHVKDN
ncbi:MAG TPA: type II toxin-antitoxin system RelB/DinJ family antitoxin [Candidatus Alectryocaccobium stercorigallinarum]|nr:type II toxin-antitoxin system RelB/DinJ family antitoxin [Candidatus Alectryocaccobium stercorigallinarum]